jgi:hypothetical protein
MKMGGVDRLPPRSSFDRSDCIGLATESELGTNGRTMNFAPDPPQADTRSEGEWDD